MKKQKQRYLFKIDSESELPILIWLSVLWPIIVIIIGTFIMIWAGVNECPECGLFEKILYVLTSSWGWVGVILFAVGVGAFLYQIVRGFINWVSYWISNKLE